MFLTKRAAYLCDFPPFLREPDDASLPLRLSAGPLDQLAARFRDGVEWMPFCRTLGVLRMGARGQALDVLQISVRTPLFLEPDWPAQLIKEAHDIQFHKAWRSGSTYLEDWIKRYRFLVAKAESEHPGLDDEALALQWGDDLARCILEWMFIPDRLFEVENNPYERTEGFWTMLASILPAWRDRFPLKKGDVSALLRAFDAAYDESWETLLRELSLSGLFRFTPGAMKKIRVRIAALADPEVEAGVPDSADESANIAHTSLATRIYARLGGGILYSQLVHFYSDHTCPQDDRRRDRYMGYLEGGAHISTVGNDTANHLIWLYKEGKNIPDDDYKWINACRNNFIFYISSENDKYFNRSKTEEKTEEIIKNVGDAAKTITELEKMLADNGKKDYLLDIKETLIWAKLCLGTISAGDAKTQIESLAMDTNIDPKWKKNVQARYDFYDRFPEHAGNKVNLKIA